jgi:site-specific recombinase XerD
MEQYFKFLVDNKQQQSTRLGNLVHIRIYLEWLKERKLISCKPRDMVRSIDFPKVPDYLPRPLPPAIDQLIQKRLAKSEDRFHRALLLMRWTGIRIGELRLLSFDCIKTDIHGHKFLKVPLGKLNNERLVPLDEKTVRLIKTIQGQTSGLVNQQPDFLLAEKTLKPPRTYLLMTAFREIYEDIKTEEPIVSHRLRHTYATELLSAGMNICALKEILGHRDINMTLRYAAVTQEKVRNEYFAALTRMKTGFPVDDLPAETNQVENDYEVLLSDLVLKLKKRAPVKGLSTNKLLHLTKRINRLKKDVQTILY